MALVSRTGSYAGILFDPGGITMAWGTSGGPAIPCGDGFANNQRAGARLAFIGPMEAMAAWCAQLVGIATLFTVVGLSGFRRELRWGQSLQV
jgi:hypothetical protein